MKQRWKEVVEREKPLSPRCSTLDTDVVLMLRNSQNPSDFVTFSTLLQRWSRIFKQSWSDAKILAGMTVLIHVVLRTNLCSIQMRFLDLLLFLLLPNTSLALRSLVVDIWHFFTTIYLCAFLPSQLVECVFKLTVSIWLLWTLRFNYRR